MQRYNFSHQVIKRIGVSRAQPEGGIVTFFRLNHLALFFEGVRQIAVRIWEVGLQFDSASICVDGQIDKPVTSERQCTMELMFLCHTHLQYQIYLLDT